MTGWPLCTALVSAFWLGMGVAWLTVWLALR